MKMKRTMIWLVTVAFGITYVVTIAGCASTKIKRLSGEEFVKHAECVDRLGSFTWETYIGVSDQRAYLEYGHPAFIGKGDMITVYWTSLEDLPDNLARQLKAGTPPWTNWMNFEHPPRPR
jgi:hypothetical protein